MPATVPVPPSTPPRDGGETPWTPTDATDGTDPFTSIRPPVTAIPPVAVLDGLLSTSVPTPPLDSPPLASGPLKVVSTGPLTLVVRTEPPKSIAPARVRLFVPTTLSPPSVPKTTGLLRVRAPLSARRWRVTPL